MLAAESEKSDRGATLRIFVVAMRKTWLKFRKKVFTVPTINSPAESPRLEPWSKKAAEMFFHELDQVRSIRRTSRRTKSKFLLPEIVNGEIAEYRAL